MFHFYTPWKLQKTRVFLFSGGKNGSLIWNELISWFWTIFSITGVSFSSNKSTGYCPKLAVICSIRSQRSYLHRLFFSFLIKVQKLTFLDKVWHKFEDLWWIIVNMVTKSFFKNILLTYFRRKYNEYDCIFSKTKK